MLRKMKPYIACFACFAFLLVARDLSPKDTDFKIIDVVKLNRYFEDRIAYQQFEKPHDQFHVNSTDNSIAVLMIIKDKKIYLFKDGYDDAELIRNKIIMYNNGNQLAPDVWENKISGSPNFLQVSDRKVELQKIVSKESLAANYKDYYIKIRNEFIKKHAAIFLSLIFHRRETEMAVSRKEIPRKMSDAGAKKYAISVSARARDESAVYYAEDADGDGITETFTVNTSDGFTWGYRVGANMINIKNNTQKDVEKIIGRIAGIAYYGSPEEEQMIKQSFPSPDKITGMINDLYRIDPETNKYLKENKLNVEETIERASSKADNK